MATIGLGRQDSANLEREPMSNSDRMQRDIKRSLETLNRLTPSLIADLVRRAGTRATPERTQSNGPRGKGTHSDPTMASVVRKLSGDTLSDPIYDAVRGIALALDAIAKECQRIDDAVRFSTNGAERARESTIIHCEACQREVAGTPKDRVRSGLCQACYARWVRAGRPYRQQFFFQVQQELSETL